MEAARGSSLFVLMTSSEVKKDLRSKLGELFEEFKRENINGSITLHFSQGFLAKIQSTKFD